MQDQVAGKPDVVAAIPSSDPSSSRSAAVPWMWLRPAVSAPSAVAPAPCHRLVSARSSIRGGTACSLPRRIFLSVRKQREGRLGMEYGEMNLGAAEKGDGRAGIVEEEGFEPTEDELVLHFLWPQLRGFAPRVAGAVVEADPCSAAPWELLARHGLRVQGYFFAARRRRWQGRSRSSSSLARRSVKGGGGSWMHSSSKDDCASVTELGVVVRWSRVRYGF